MARGIDWILVVTIILLVGIGLISILNATANPFTGEEQTFFEKLQNLDGSLVMRQTIFFLGSIVMVIVILTIDYQTLKDYTPAFYWVCIVVVSLLFVFGTVTKNVQSWYRIGALGLQPSEIAKVATIMMLAKMLAARQGEKIETFGELAKPVGIVLLPFILVTVQGDLGTAMVYFFMALGMLLVAGINWRIVAVSAGIGLVVVLIVWFVPNILQDYQRGRILSFFNPEADATGAGYNVRFSKIAIGSGQLTGRGMFSEGGLAQLNWVPEKETDFIFSVTAESFGFIGGVFVIVLYAVLLFRTLLIAMRTRDRFGSLVCVGIACMTMFHIFENIGMSMGIMPVTGIPLPFISYGGSNLVTNMMAYGIVLNIGARGQRRT